ncbi:MAG: heme exporter protein CcmD [Zoogloea sp.]|uniref:heme exporter protein CcmD n=1 Tax=Zoogloea sp. TaxID=49181 RepID=UPI00261F0303|nr:heme exporter protein CcmD [Zoogloea sp.]MDD2987787.1 heme exporter protein CcmD [Zoogloea sp.]
MNWGSAGEFFAMGGYGLYVWGSFGVTAAALLIEVVLVRHRLAAVRRGLRRELAADRDTQD